MSAGRAYFKKGTTPPTQAGYTAIYAGNDGAIRALFDDGSDVILQASGTIPGSGLVQDGLYFHVQSGTGITVNDNNIELDLAYLNAAYAASGTYALNTLTLTAGDGMTGGGDLTANRTFDVGAGTGISVSAGSVNVDFAAVQASGDYPTIAYADTRYALSGASTVGALTDLSDVTISTPTSGQRLTYNGSAWINEDMAIGENLTKGEADGFYEVSGTVQTHEGLADPHPNYLLESVAATTYEASGYADTQRAAHESVYNHSTFVANTLSLTAGSGLTGGGDLSTDRSFAVGAGTGITVNANDVAVDFSAVQASGNYVTEAAGDIRYSLSGTGGATSLDALTDTNLGTLASGHVLSYNGTEWINADADLAASTTASGNHVFQQFTATGSYKLNHNFGVYPAVQVFDSGLNYIDVDINLSGLNDVEITFAGTLTNAYILASVGGANNFSGLQDVQSTGWTSGVFASWNGSMWVPHTGSGLAGSGLGSGSPVLNVGQGYGIQVTNSGVKVDTATLDTRYALSGQGGGGASISLVIATSGQQEVRELIGRVELTASSGTFHFQNIPQNFDHLEYKVRARSDSGPSNVVASIMFNGDATAENYDVTTHYFAGDEANGVTHLSVSNEDTRRGGVVVGGTQTAGLFANIVGRIDWYSRNNAVKHWVFDSVWAHSDGNATFYKMEEAGRWNSNDAITNIEYDCNTGNFASGTIMELWGIKTQWVVTSGQYGSLTISNGLIVP